MLPTPKLRQALDISKEPMKSVERFTRNKPAKARYPVGDPLHVLIARRLVEAGVPVVHFTLGYWDWHGDNFTAGRQQFLSMVRELADKVDQEALREALVGPWRRASRLPSMGWDARGERIYALRGPDPAGEKRTGRAR